MKRLIIRIVSVTVIFAMLAAFAGVFTASASRQTDLQNQIAQLENKSKQLESQINNLKSQKNSQAALKAAIESKIANTQQQINLCNNEINSINASIAANKAEIAKRQQEIEDDKLSFKKRIRAIYMSSTNSAVQVLMGADSFSDYLQLEQLTSAVSAHDKAMIEKIVAAIEVLNAKQAENEKLLSEQVAIKETIAAKQAELKAEQAQIQGVINSLSSEESGLSKENASVESLIKSANNELNSILYAGSGSALVYDGGDFLWPVAGHYGITSGYGSRWGSMHYGVDISDGGISGAPVRAIANGYVYKTCNSCSHNYGKSGSCGCGGGYGNYVAIDHGTLNGVNFKAYYAHMSRCAVGMGAYVTKGQIIGYVGSTGWSTGFHLHFGIMKNNAWVNPMGYYNRVK